MHNGKLKIFVHFLVTACWLSCYTDGAASDPFALRLPRDLDSQRFEITTFAQNLNFPVGMAELADGSILVGVSNGSFFGGTTGQILRLVDADGDGVAESRTVVANNVPGGGLSSLRTAGNLVIVTGQGTPISIYRLGDQPADQLLLLGTLEFEYPAGRWLHAHSALAVQGRSDCQLDNQQSAECIDLYFQLGSATNFAPSINTVSLSSSFGLSGELQGDSIYRVSLYSTETELQGTSLFRIASGLRNAAGMLIHPTTGDLYLQDNGIDGLINANEPTSADELNVVPARLLGSETVDFGFPDAYVEYRTGARIGDRGEFPLAAILPIPEPQDGSEAEGPNDISLGPIFLHLGDMAYGSGTFTEFEAHVFDIYRDLLHEVPTYPAPGNHEYKTEVGQPYLDVYYLWEQALRETDQERYYSFDYGDVHFVSLDSNGETLLPAAIDTENLMDDDMLDWLEADLAASDKPWKIAFFHHPPYTSSERDPNVLVRNGLLPLLEAGGVDLVLCGHDHHYERTKAIKEGEPVLHEEGGIYYFVVGSGGAGLRVATGDWWTEAVDDQNHAFLDLRVRGCTAIGQAISLDGDVIDEFELDGC